MKKAGFEVDSSKKGQDKNKPKGAVIKQSATKAAKGATIVITINTYSGSSENTNSNSHSENTTKPSKPNNMTTNSAENSHSGD